MEPSNYERLNGLSGRVPTNKRLFDLLKNKTGLVTSCGEPDEHVNRLKPNGHMIVNSVRSMDCIHF